MTKKARDEVPRPQKTSSHAADLPGDGSMGASFPIVGVGASAGGLEAFTELLRHLPLDTGMGFVLVQHLDPQHESALTQILSRATSLPVEEVTNNLRVKGNHVYIIPPNTSLAISRGVLTLEPRPESRTPHRSIDSFFESLADDQSDQAIGVILSGTATDGTLGLEAIKAEGGITFAQDESARYDSMPRSAVAAGCVDFVLSPENIAKELARIAKHPYVARQATRVRLPEDDGASVTAREDDEAPLQPDTNGDPARGAKRARARGGASHGKPQDNGFRKILLLLRNHCGVDFSLYKASTIQRRITRRMVLSKQDSLDAYAEFLRGNTQELDALYSDALISVTNFFRNPEAFDVLTREVFPKLLHERGDEPIRVWVLGCSTGQEAYSIAMAFVEAAEKAPRARRLQVFATDLNEALLDKARHGLYAKSLVQDIAPERLRRFFVEEQGGYRVTKALREMVVFARQNLITDPSFSRLNLISCRNLLIYLEPSLQAKVLHMFHYALKPEGFVLLGVSESLGSSTELFEPVDKKYKVYLRKSVPTPSLRLPVKPGRGEYPSPDRSQAVVISAEGEQGKGPEGFRAEPSAQREADRVIANQFAPPGVLITSELQVLQFRGSTSEYLQPPTGKASFDVLKMAREGLMLPLRAAINKAKKENKTAREESIRVGEKGSTRTVNVEVIPLKNLKERCFLVLFEDADTASRSLRGTPPPDERSQAVRSKDEEAARNAELERELLETRDYLQCIQEQYEAANEELQASSEEVQSANEELQSINEELETSKEELESANEELSTLNEEMGNRNVELGHLNSDLLNLQTSTQLAIVLLGRDLTIRRFSAKAEKEFNLLASDIGRALSTVRHTLDIPDLEDLVSEVIGSLLERVVEVRDKDGRWYSLRARPYMTLDNKVDGAVLVLVDIDELKRSAQAAAEAREHVEAILRTVPDPLVLLSPDLRIQSANDAFYRTFKSSPTETEGRALFELGEAQWNVPKLRQLLEDIIPRNSFFDEFQITQDFERLGRRSMLLSARPLHEIGGKARLILLGIRDITETLTYQAELRQSEARKHAILKSALDAIITMDHEGRCLEFNPAAETVFGYERREVIGKPLADLMIPERLREKHYQGMARYLATGYGPVLNHPIEMPALRADGTEFVAELAIVPIPASRPPMFTAFVRDISERKRHEELRAEQARLLDLSNDAIVVYDMKGHIKYWNRGAEALYGWPSEEALGKEYHVLLSAECPKPNEEILEELVREGRWNGECVHSRRDGQRIAVLARKSLDRDGAGSPAAILETCTDITERKQAEETLRDAAKRKNEFMATLAHELRNPLAPIRNMLEVMKRGETTPDLMEHARATMERQLNHMTVLIDDLMDVNRISRGKLELRRKEVEIGSVIHHAVDTCRPAIDLAKHELSVTLPREPVYVNADPMRLAQVVSNLLNNSAKFTEPGGRIRLTVEREGGEVVIAVRDNGVGISPELLPRVFDMFMQVDKSFERSQGGLGIGLSLVKQLVEMHGGAVSVSSEGPGRGSEFVIRLPALSRKPKREPQEPVESEPSRTTGRHILVVDDNHDSAESLATLLSITGNQTRTAHDGLEALEAAEKFKPDVVLLDIGLPKLNGCDVCRKIREEPWGKRMVVIALTGWGNDEDRLRTKEAGFNGHLVKPVSYESLSKLLSELLPT